MMKRATSNAKSNQLEIKQGTAIIGKWNREKYYVLRKIGAGMVGTVYLCRSKGSFVALKISKQSLSMTSEVNVLKALSKAGKARIGPRLLDVDDWVNESDETYSFYVMEYIRGVALESFIKDRGNEWVGIFLIQMLDQLEALHQTGWIFGDLKNDNLLVTKDPPEVRFIDVGGTTKLGRSVKEYSELYDRGYWNLGSRTAEPSYDLFSLAMVMLYSFNPQKIKKSTYSRQLICQRVDESKELDLFSHSLKRAICGHFKTAAEMKADILLSLVTGGKQEKVKRKGSRKNFVEPVLLLCLTTIYGIITYVFF